MDRTENRRLKDKVVGCMVGGAAGDALGYAVEFNSRADILNRYGRNGITRYELDSRSGKALISDDTQMSLFTAAGCLLGMTRECVRGIMGRLHSYCFNTYQNWLVTQSRPFVELPLKYPFVASEHEYFNIFTWLMRVPQLYSRRAPGMTCLDALRALEEGRKNYRNNSCGCGGVMRTAPIALICACHSYSGNADDEAAEAARITHHHPLGFLPSAMLNHILMIILHSEDSSKAVLEGAIIETMQTLGSFRCVREQEKTYATLYPKDVRTLVELCNKVLELDKSQLTDIECIERLGQGWTGHEALAIALLCALRHSDSFEDAIVSAVNHDGDSDSTGAICGNIMGVLLGRNAIPDFYTNDLEIIDVIEEMAEDLYTGCPIGEFVPMDTTEKWRWDLAYINHVWKPRDQMLEEIRSGKLFQQLGWEDYPKDLRGVNL